MVKTIRFSVGRLSDRRLFFGALMCAGVFLAGSAAAQEPAELVPAELVVDPPELTLEVGKTAQLTATVKDADGNTLERGVVFFSRARRFVGVNPAGMVEAHRPGDQTLIAMVPADPDAMDRRAEPALMVEIAVRVPWPPLASVEIAALPANLYAGTSLRVSALAQDTSGAERKPDFAWSSSDASVATVSEHGVLMLLGEGSATISASAESVSGEAAISVSANPAVRLDVSASEGEVRTGDVVWFNARALDASGNEVPDYPPAVRSLHSHARHPGGARCGRLRGARRRLRGRTSGAPHGGGLRRILHRAGDDPRHRAEREEGLGSRGPGAGPRPPHLGPVGLGRR